MLLFLAAFLIEVRVKAESMQLPITRELTEQPRACWNKDIEPCAVQTTNGEKSVLKFAGGVLTLDRSTTVVRLSASRLRVTGGAVWIKVPEAIEVLTEFGSFVLSSHGGEAWIVNDGQRAIASAIDGGIDITPRGSRETLVIDPLFENWLGKAGPDGKARVGVPVAIAFKPHLKRWARLYNGPKSAFEVDAQKFHESWSQAVKEAADLHQTLFERKMASVEADSERRSVERKKVEQRNRELREIFRRKVFEE